MEPITNISEGKRKHSDFQLLETLLLDEGTYILRERHLQRLLTSANYFHFYVSPDAIRKELHTLAQARPAGRWRIRLCVSQEGYVVLEQQPVQPLPPGPLPIALARSAVAKDDIFLTHKTTNRTVYDSRRTDHPDVFDVLLWNEQGELTEFTTGNLVVELGARRLTPADSSGLLPGTLRAELLDQGQIQPQTLALPVLQQASRLWFINSVRGWVEVRLTASTIAL